MNTTRYQRILSLFGLLVIILLGQFQQMFAQPSVSSAETDADPKKVVLPSPEPPLSIAYPADAVQEGIEGLVRLRVLLDKAGEILQIESMDTTVNRGLLYAAVSGLEKMRFNPGKIDGASATMWAVAEIDFRIETLQQAEASPSKESEERNDFPEFVPEATPPLYNMNELASYLQYPPEAEAKGLEATLYIKVAVDKEGNLRNIKVVSRRGTNAEMFEEAALNAVRQTEFSPAVVKGEPVNMSITVPIRFTLTP
ncbi:MAG: TonB family protein [Ignavibacteriae bacterium]|nr:TonB family protein [Ignavibacteriota bacterium]MCB9214494.1 TonB family protein [Ignavibacteria bacterium]